MKRAYVHIGTHKTGTTSFQAFLQENSEFLRERGVTPYRGLLHRRNHVELFLSVVRSNLENSASNYYADLDPVALRERSRREIDGIFENDEGNAFICSCEYLSFLRDSCEFERFRSLFPEDVEFEVILVLRNKKEYLESYRNQMFRTGFRPSENRKSAFYVEADTWLLDYDHIVSLWEQNIGRVHVIEYDKSKSISKILEVLGVYLPSADKLYRLNNSDDGKIKTSAFSKARKKLARTAFGSFLRFARRKLYFLSDAIFSKSDH